MYNTFINNNNNNNIRAGRPASSGVGSPYSRPAITGKPGIMLVLPCFGFSRSPLPALCRQATSCAWRSRLRKIFDWRSGCSRGRAKVRSGWHPWGKVAPQIAARPNRSGVSWASWGGLRVLSGRGCGPRDPPESSGDACQTLRSRWSGGQMCPKTFESFNIFNIASKH